MFGETQLMAAYILFLVTSLASPFLLHLSKKTAVCIGQSALIVTLLYLFVTGIIGGGYYADTFILFNVLIVVNTVITLYAANAIIRSIKIADKEPKSEDDIQEEEEILFDQKHQTINNGSIVFLPNEKVEKKEYFLRTIKEKIGIKL